MPSPRGLHPLARLHTVRRHREMAAALAGALWTAMAFALLVNLAATVEALAHLGIGGRAALWMVIAAGGAGIGGAVFARAWRSVGDMPRIAADVERRYPAFRERLVAGWEFSTGPAHGSRSLADAVIGEAATLLASVDLRPLVSWAPASRAAVALVAALGVSAGSLVIWRDALLPAYARLLSPTEPFVAAAPFTMDVQPGDVRMAKGDTLTVRVRLAGRLPGRIEITSRQADAPVLRSDVVAVPPSGAVVWRWPQLRDDAEYQVIAGPIRSPTYRVKVVERPEVRRLQVMLAYPAYTGLGRDTLAENEGNVSAIVGTAVAVSIRANKRVAAAAIRFNEGDSLSLRLDDDRASGTWTVARDGSYTISLRDEYGYRNPDPIPYRIQAVGDESPSVRIVEPERETDLGQDMIVPLRIEATDDFGFDRLEVEYRPPDGRARVLRLPLTTLGRGQAESRYLWDLGSLDLLPEDRVTYKAVIYDNDRVRGPKKSETEEYVLRFPSAAEVFAEAEAQQEAQVSSLTETLDRSHDLGRRLDALRRELLKTQDLTWESRQEAQRLAERQAQMNEEMAQVAEEMQRTVAELERHNVLSPETLEKVSQIRQLMSQVITPELRQALEQMQATAQRMVDPERVRQAMEQLAGQRQEFEERLDRILNLLRQARADEELDAMSRRMEELARLQRDAAESFLRQPSQTLANREHAIGEQTSEAERELARMAEDMRDLSASPSDSLTAIAGQLDRERAAERLGQLSRQLASGTPQQSLRPEAGRLAEALERAAAQMRRGAEARQHERQQEVAQKLDRAATDLLRLSMMQEDLLHETPRASTDRLDQLGEEQVDLQQGTTGVVGRIVDASGETFLIPPEALGALQEALRAMSQATAALEQKSGSMAADLQRQAMAALNQAVDQIRRAEDQARQSRSGAGLEQLLQQLSEMARRQRALNEMMERMGGQGSLSESQMQMLAQMAAEQQALGEALRQMAEELERYRQVLGRLGDAAGEMEQSAEEMARGQLGPHLQDRQRRILRRLLDAQRSLYQGQRGEERVAETARDRRPSNPGALPDDLGERRVFLREAMLQALRADYPPEYRAWIRRYYERLLAEEDAR